MKILDAFETLDRRAPLPRDIANGFLRTLNDGRALLGLGSLRHLENTTQPFDFFYEWLVISLYLKRLNVQHKQALPRILKQSNRRLPPPW